MEIEVLREQIEARYDAGPPKPADLEPWFGLFMKGLTQGLIRAAEPHEGAWSVNRWVKQGILLGFRAGRLVEYSAGPVFRFFDKDTFPLRPTLESEGVRIVPGGTSIRSGSYLAPGVVIMPPAYVNVGGYVGPDSMIDSHALVGSCAQIGARVHLSAAAQIGGVLEPVGAMPVIVEDDVMIGGNSGIYEGTIVRRHAVIGAGTVLTSSIPVYDLVRQLVLRGSREEPLEIPEGAVVIPGSRRLNRSEFEKSLGLAANCALIVKYRDERTGAATALEEALR